MFTRQNNTVGKALRNTQEKGKALRIKKNAMLKKAIKDMILIDLMETEEERLELIQKQKKYKKSIKKLKSEIMTLKKQVQKCRTHFASYLMTTVAAAITWTHYWRVY